MARLYVGIDVHSRFQQVAILSHDQLSEGDEAWKRAKSFTVANTQEDFTKLQDRLEKTGVTPQDIAIGIDHTGGFYSAPITTFLSQFGYTLYFFQGKAQKDARDRLLGEEDKEDELDAGAMARALYLRDISGEQMRISLQAPDLFSAASALRALTSMRYKLTKMETQMVNRLHQYLTATFPEAENLHFDSLLPHLETIASPQDVLARQDERPPSMRKNVWASLIKLAGNSVGVKSAAYADVVKATAKLRVQIAEKIAFLEERIHEGVKDHPYYPILVSFPGINDVSAATLIGMIGDIGRWTDKASFRKAMGMYGRTSQSGEKKPKGKMGREGSPAARRILYIATMSCLNPHVADNRVRAYYQALQQKGKKGNQAMVAAARKFSDLMYVCLKSSQHYRYQGKDVK